MFLFCSNSFEGRTMVRTVLEEALALTSLSLFLATIAVWAQYLGSCKGFLSLATFAGQRAPPRGFCHGPLWA
jgi:hypothetical protein